MKLRPAQATILEYRAGRMAISAVPGSGKTFVLTRLAARLIADGRLDTAAGQQVLIVTYLNSSVDNFKARIAAWLHELGLYREGYDVRTLHSLAREILLSGPAAAGMAGEFPILDEGQSDLYLARAVDNWIKDNPAAWQSFLPSDAADSPRLRARWRNITQGTARGFVRLAKNGRYSPAAVRNELEKAVRQRASAMEDHAAHTQPSSIEPPFPLITMLAGIYDRYRAALETQGALDFDDMVWRAADLLDHNPGMVEALCRRWPYVLEDEAQDSVPLQETLLETLTQATGNWVRAGDPNQAIMSSFTSAHPRHFRAFLARPDVVERPLPESGRSARMIAGLANRLVEWACAEHPVAEVRDAAFRPQTIRPTPPGDAQPNPPDAESTIHIKVFGHREREELPAIARAAWERTRQHQGETIAILVPTNDAGHALAEHLDALEADYDELLRGSGRTRQVAASLHAILGLLAHPLEARRLEAGLNALLDLEALSVASLPTPDRERVLTLLRSVHRPEALLYPPAGRDIADALPRGVATPNDKQVITAFVECMRHWFDALALPADSLILVIADDIFHSDADLSIAYQVSAYSRTLLDANPSWRLPELVAQLERVAAGSARIMGAGPADAGYEPQPGRITLTTQHRAKGLEWDTVFVAGIDGSWIPGHLDAHFMGVHDFLGGDPAAEAAAQLLLLMEGNAGLLPGLSATDTTHVEVIAERLRLLYVCITRARRHLFISRSRSVTVYDKERDTVPSSALGVLYRYLKSLDDSPS